MSFNATAQESALVMTQLLDPNDVIGTSSVMKSKAEELKKQCNDDESFGRSPSLMRAAGKGSMVQSVEMDS